MLAPAAGFEPTPTALETVTPVLKTGVLPLHYADVWDYLPYLFGVVFLFSFFRLKGTQPWLYPSSIELYLSIQYFSLSLSFSKLQYSTTSHRNPRLDLFQSFCISLFGWCPDFNAVWCWCHRSYIFWLCPI